MRARKGKELGLALIVVVALGAITGSAAHAANFKFGKNTTYIGGSGTGIQTFTLTSGTIKCKKATFAGEVTGTSVSAIKGKPTYSECTAFGQSANFTTAGCEYTYDANGTWLSLTGCSAGGEVIHVPAGNCSVTIPNQHFTSATVSYTNEGSGETRDVLITHDTTNRIDYTVHGPGTICGTPGSYIDFASYTSSVTTRGYADAALTIHAPIWVE